MRALLLILSLLAFLPSVSGAHAPCTAENVGGVDAPVYVFRPGARTIEVWQEENGFPGLQRDACIGPAGEAVARDSFVTTVDRPDLGCIADIGGTQICIA